MLSKNRLVLLEPDSSMRELIADNFYLKNLLKRLLDKWLEDADPRECKSLLQEIKIALK